MKRSMSMSEASSTELEEYLQEQELAKLQRQMHVLDEQNTAFQAQANETKTKQQKELNLLTVEGEEISTSLNRALSTKHMAEDSNMTEQLGVIMDAEDDIKEAMKEEEKCMAELDMQILVLERQVDEQKIEIGGLKVVEEKEVQTRRKLRTLSNRLDKAVTKFNLQLAKNANMREAIDNLRHERGIFDKLYKKVLKQLDNVRKETGMLIENATQAYEQRDEAKSKMQSLKERGDKEKALFDSEMKALQVVISHDNKLKEFMNIKANERLEYQAIEAAKRKKHSGDDRPEEETMTLMTYEDLFEQIKEVTGTGDLTTMVENFIENEDSNFALYNYVNELNNEIETQQDQIQCIKRDIKQFIMEDTQTEISRDAILIKLEDEIKDKMAVVNENSSKLKAINATLDSLKMSVQQLFVNLQCDLAPIKEMLGCTEEVTNKNIMMHLGMIEHRTTELMNLKIFLDRPLRPSLPNPNTRPLSVQKKRNSTAPKKPGDQQMTTVPIVVPKPPERSNIEINPPDSKEELGDDDDDQKPLTHAELQTKVVRNITKKDQMPRPSANKSKA